MSCWSVAVKTITSCQPISTCYQPFGFYGYATIIPFYFFDLGIYAFANMAYYPGTEGTSILRFPVPLLNVIFKKIILSFLLFEFKGLNLNIPKLWISSLYNSSITNSSISIFRVKEISEKM